MTTLYTYNWLVEPTETADTVVLVFGEWFLSVPGGSGGDSAAICFGVEF